MDPEQIRAAVHDLFSKGDETIIEYVCGILEDEHFEFGEDGEGAFDSIGPFLVSPMLCTGTPHAGLAESGSWASAPCAPKPHLCGLKVPTVCSDRWGVLRKRRRGKGGVPVTCRTNGR